MIQFTETLVISIYKKQIRSHPKVFTMSQKEKLITMTHNLTFKARIICLID